MHLIEGVGGLVEVVGEYLGVGDHGLSCQRGCVRTTDYLTLPGPPVDVDLDEVGDISVFDRAEDVAGLHLGAVVRFGSLADRSLASPTGCIPGPGSHTRDLTTGATGDGLSATPLALGLSLSLALPFSFSFSFSLTLPLSGTLLLARSSETGPGTLEGATGLGQGLLTPRPFETRLLSRRRMLEAARGGGEVALPQSSCSL